MDTSNKSPVSVNGPVYNAPIFNIGPNPVYGNVNNNHPPASVPVVEVKDAPEVDEHGRCPIPKPLAYELIAIWLTRQQAGPAQNTPTLTASINSVNNLQDFKFGSPSASSETSSDSRLSNNCTHFSARRAASRKAQSNDEDDNIIMESDTIHTPTAISMSASRHSRTAIPTRRTSNTTSATNPESQFPKATLRSGSIRGNTTATSRNAKQEVTIADNDKFGASFAESKQLTMLVNTASVGRSRERTEEVDPPRANKHPRPGSIAVQKSAEFENSNTERKNYLRGQDTSQPQPTRATVRVSCRSNVVSQDAKENFKPSALASQDRSGKMVSAGPSSAAGQRDLKANKMQLLQSANAKFRSTGALSTPTSTSSHSLVSVATKAASAANTNTLRRQQPTPSTVTNFTRSTSSMVSSCNSFQTYELSKGNSSGSMVLANRITSDKMTAAMGKKATVASAAQEEPDKFRKRRDRVSSRPSKVPILVTTLRERERERTKALCCK